MKDLTDDLADRVIDAKEIIADVPKVAAGDSSTRLLVVDDDRDFAQSLEEILSGNGYNVHVVHSQEGALKEMQMFGPQIVLLDIRLGTSDGLFLLQEIRNKSPKSSVIMMTAFAEVDTVIRSLQDGAYDYLRKPIFPAQLLHSVGKCVDNLRLLREREEAVVALRESEERYHLAVQGANEGIWDWDLCSDKVFLTPRLREIIRHPEWSATVSRQTVLECIHPECRTDVADQVKGYLNGELQTYFCEYRLLDADCHEVWVLDRGTVVRDPEGTPVRMVGSFSDISERKRLEAQLVQTQKMEAIGSLAGGLAHDFNNLLTGIMGYASLLKLDLGDNQRLIREVELIEKAADRARDLTSKLLNFARQGMRRNLQVDIHKVIEEVTQLIERTFDRNISLKTDLQATSSQVFGDPGQFHQILLNLAINARDALENSQRKEICFSSEVVELKENIGMLGGEFRPGLFLKVDVKDTGHGMNQEVIGRAFEPFFTTKGSGRGLGMGLAIVYGILKDHSGFVDVQSVANQGTSVIIYLPLSVSSLAVTSENNTSEQILLPDKAASVLLVDDEEVLRSVGEQMLKRLGYSVVTRSSGEEGLEYYREHWTTLSLVLLDVVMPGMSGVQSLKEILDINPEARVVMCSGLGISGELSSLVKDRVKFIRKPFSLGQLSVILRNALD